MKYLPRAILCLLGLLIGCLLLQLTNPLNKGGEKMNYEPADVVGWETNRTRNTSQYILKNNLTAIIMPEHVCDQKSLLLIIVCSAKGNLEARKAVRETWGSERYVLGQNVSLYFLLGETANSSVQNEVMLESKQYGDIIQERFIDSYNNLTLKSISMLKIATSYCINSTKYLLKIDDDMLLNVPLLIKMLLKRNYTGGFLLGSLRCNEVPVDDVNSKWYSPKYMFEERIYPNYLSGTGYLMTLDVAEKLFNVALETPIFYLEDVYLTGICARKVHIKPRNSPLFTHKYLPDEPCVFRRLITIHHFPPTFLREIYKTLKDPHLSRNCELYKPFFSIYDWLLRNILKSKNEVKRNVCD